jgi:hypothetical protein
VLQLASRGLRERVVKKCNAPNTPFAIGEFELILEAQPGREDVAPPVDSTTADVGPLIELRPRVDARAKIMEGRLPPKLALCHACNQYIYPHETTCTHCGADVALAAADHAETVQRRRALIERLERALALSGSSSQA